MYCRTREGCQSLADKLSSKGIKARAYHAGAGCSTSRHFNRVYRLCGVCVCDTGIANKERDEVQRQWMSGEVPVIVATVSFGMGVDKSNVRYMSCDR